LAFPTIHACLLCDFARQELGNKTILIGFYGAAPDVRIIIHDFKLPVQLCLVFCGGPGEGQFKVEVKLRGPKWGGGSGHPSRRESNSAECRLKFFYGNAADSSWPGDLYGYLDGER
jgi:hypothetical protein